ncbi:MAG: putative endonuclease [Gammaproteobacteria bacterium]
MINKNTANQNGIIAEKIALTFLTNEGLSELKTNYRSKYGEIDLIMSDINTIVFIEVRYRSNTKFIDPIETIDKSKIQRIITTSQIYLQEFPEHDKLYRFDIITLTGNIDLPQIKWIKNAFAVQ